MKSVSDFPLVEIKKELEGLAGCGSRKARNLLNRWPSVSVSDAVVEAVKEIEGGSSVTDAVNTILLWHEKI